MMPNAGTIRMYTSGWPKIQKMCCHSTTFPPAATSKKFARNSRSNISSTSPTVIAGKANRINSDVINDAHVNIGIRMNVMPGARILMIVTRKLMPPIREPIPEICRPST